MGEPILVLESVRKAYGALTVSDDVSMSVERGAVHALIGPNGAGKTTLVGQIAGQILSDAGTILFDGRNITREPIHARSHLGLARTFQITSMLPAFTVLDNVAVAAQAHAGHSFRFLRPVAAEASLNDKAMRALEAVGLADRAPMLAGALSHGEKRRLEIAIALATEPSLLLLDEPMAGVGREETERLVATLQALRGQVSLLLIEHDMQAVFALADRITVLDYGRVIAEDTPDAIRANSEVRAAYLGEEGVA